VIREKMLVGQKNPKVELKQIRMGIMNHQFLPMFHRREKTTGIV